MKVNVHVHVLDAPLLGAAGVAPGYLSLPPGALDSL